MAEDKHQYICRVNGFTFYTPGNNGNSNNILVEHPEYPGFSANKTKPEKLRGNHDYSREEIMEILYEEYYTDLWSEVK